MSTGITFSQLSMILNEVMGWCGYHMFEFEFYHKELRLMEGAKECGGAGPFDYLEASTTFIREFMEYDVEYVNQQLKNQYFYMVGKREIRCQNEIYKDHFRGKYGLKVTKNDLIEIAKGKGVSGISRKNKNLLLRMDK